MIGGLQRDAAIECLRPELSGPEEVAKRFRNEARTLAKLSHPDIATTYQFFTDNDRLYLVMEYIQGTPFGGCLKEKGGLYSARRTDRVGSAAARRAEAAGEGARGC